MGLVVLGNHKATARFLVEPMHNTGSFLAPDPG